MSVDTTNWNSFGLLCNLRLLINTVFIVCPSNYWIPVKIVDDDRMQNYGRVWDTIYQTHAL